jgi:hypothetical protein
LELLDYPEALARLAQGGHEVLAGHYSAAALHRVFSQDIAFN